MKNTIQKYILAILVLVTSGCEIWDNYLIERNEKAFKSRMEHWQNVTQKHPEWSDKTAMKIKAGEIELGMTQEMVLEAMGGPFRINRTEGPNSSHEQWVYKYTNAQVVNSNLITTDVYKFLSFDNGIVTYIHK